MARNTMSSTPWTATPTMRNGSRTSQMKGYATSASRANGQHRTNRMHQSRKVNIAGRPPSDSLYVRGREEVPSLGEGSGESNFENRAGKSKSPPCRTKRDKGGAPSGFLRFPSDSV